MCETDMMLLGDIDHLGTSARRLHALRHVRNHFLMRARVGAGWAEIHTLSEERLRLGMFR